MRPDSHYKPTRRISRRDDQPLVRVVEERDSYLLPLVLTIVATLGLFMLSGCKSYDANFAQTYRMGQYDAAEAQLKREAGGALKNSGNGDRLIYLLEQGTVQRTRGDLVASNEAFEAADEYLKKAADKADIRVGRTAKAAVTNLAEIAYEGYGYDRIMMNAYKALNYMEKGNFDFARAELRRVQYAQEDLERRKAGRLKDLQEEGQKSGRYNQRALSDPSLAARTQALYGDIPDLSLQASYLNAFAEYLQGMFLLHAGDAADREVARVALRNTYSMIANDYVLQDLEYAEAGANQPVTYIIHETGLAPLRKEMRIDIPVWFFNLAIQDTGVDYIGVAFPKLVPQVGGMPAVEARSSSGAHRTQLLVDMDGVVAREFKDEMPTVVTRTLVAAGAKAGVAFAAHRATKGEPLLNLLTRIGTTIYQYNVNRADLRTWRTLPKTINVARFATPADGMVQLVSPSGVPIANVRVDPNSVNVIWVRTPGDAGGAVCRVFPLRSNIVARESL